MPLVPRSRDWVFVQYGYRNLFLQWIPHTDYPIMYEPIASFGDGFPGLGMMVDAKADGMDWQPGPFLHLFLDPGEELDMRSRGHDVAGEGIGTPRFAFPVEVTSLAFHHYVLDGGGGPPPPESGIGALDWYLEQNAAPERWTIDSPPGSRGEVLLQHHEPYESILGGPSEYWKELEFGGAAIATLNALFATPGWDGLIALYAKSILTSLPFRLYGQYAPFLRVGYLEDVPEGLPGEEGGPLPWEAGGGPVAFTQAQLDSIEEAIASGSLTVRYADKMRTYRSLDELFRIRDVIRSALGLVPVGLNRQVRPVTRTGW